MGQTIGIDFGTTNTVVSYRNKNGKIVSLKVGGSRTIPSVVYYASESEYYIGSTAVDKGLLNPAGMVASFKTDIGEDNARRLVTFEDGTAKKMSPYRVAQNFLQKLMLSIQDKLIKDFGANGYIEKAVITVPAKFSPKQKERIQKSAIDAGFQTVTLECEPTAAAAAYQNDIDNDTILVYDFGGGTFDVSVVQTKKCGDSVKYEELDTSGDKNLGGNDITNAIVMDILEQINSCYGLNWEVDEYVRGLYRLLDVDSYDGKDYAGYQLSMHSITRCAENVKIYLSMDDEYTESVLVLDKSSDLSDTFEVSYTREELQDIISKYIDRTVDITKNVCNGTAQNGIKIDRVVMAGGSSNIPMIQEALRSALNIDVFPSDDFSSLISKGAIILNEKKKDDGNSVTQITNNEYGIIVKDGRILDKFEPLVPVKTKLPYSIKRSLYLNVDGQDSLEFRIYERDIQNYPNAKRSVHDGIEFVYAVSVEDLPKGLLKSNTKINLNLTLQPDGSIDILADLLVDDKVVSQLSIKK